MSNPTDHIPLDLIPVEVTEVDIQNGEPRMAQCCPVALGCKRALSPVDRVSVTAEDILVIYDMTDEYVHARYSIPPEVRSFILDFDSLKEVRPISFVATLSSTRVEPVS